MSWSNGMMKMASHSTFRRLPPHTGNAGMSLMLGRSKHDADDQFLLFHLSIRLYALSKESPRDFFLPIPTDFLDTNDLLSLSDKPAENIVPIAWQVEQSASTEPGRVMRVKTRLRCPGLFLCPPLNGRSKCSVRLEGFFCCCDRSSGPPLSMPFFPTINVQVLRRSLHRLRKLGISPRRNNRSRGHKDPRSRDLALN